LAHNRDKEAIALLQKVCSFEPGDPGHHLRLIGAHIAARNLTEAQAGARKLSKKNSAICSTTQPTTM
jgi:hypothetical protein